MKTLKLKNILVLIPVVFIFLISSCSDDEKKVKEIEEVEGSKYILVADVEVSDEDSATYILTVDDLMTGTITSQGQGIETNSSNSIFTNNKLFSFGDNCDVYDFADGVLTKNHSFAYESGDALVVSEDDQTMAGFTMPEDPGTNGAIQLFDSSVGYVIDKVETPFYVPSDENPEEANYIFAPTSTFMNNGKLFVPHIVWDLDDDWEYPNKAKSYVSIYSYPELAYEKTITTVDKGGSIGAWYDQPCHLETENGDHYLLVPNVSDPATRPDVSSSIVRINAGEDKFDEDYVYDIETPTGYRAFAGVYAGNNLAVVRVASDQFSESLWWNETEVFNTAIINLVDKTFTIVDDIPLHFMQYNTRFLVEDGKVYTFVSTLTGNYIYRVDPATATAEKGAKLEVSDVTGIFKTN